MVISAPTQVQFRFSGRVVRRRRRRRAKKRPLGGVFVPPCGWHADANEGDTTQNAAPLPYTALSAECDTDKYKDTPAERAESSGRPMGRTVFLAIAYSEIFIHRADDRPKGGHQDPWGAPTSRLNERESVFVCITTKACIDHKATTHPHNHEHINIIHHDHLFELQCWHEL